MLRERGEIRANDVDGYVLKRDFLFGIFFRSSTEKLVKLSQVAQIIAQRVRRDIPLQAQVTLIPIYPILQASRLRETVVILAYHGDVKNKIGNYSRRVADGGSLAELREGIFQTQRSRRPFRTRLDKST